MVNILNKSNSIIVQCINLKKLAIITGASSGIGEVFTRRLSERGNDLLITARREDKLNILKGELEEKYGVSVEVVVTDLSKNEDIDKLVTTIKNRDNVYYLINNAGYANIGEFQDIAMQSHREMMSVHMDAPTELSHAVLPQLVEQNEGFIINVASIAGLFTKSRYSFYGSTKAYLINFSQYLRKILQGKNIEIQALCPGFTYSGFHQTEVYKRKRIDVYNSIPKFLWMTAEEVVSSSLKKLSKKTVVHIPGLRYRVILKLVNSGLLRI